MKARALGLNPGRSTQHRQNTGCPAANDKIILRRTISYGYANSVRGKATEIETLIACTHAHIHSLTKYGLLRQTWEVTEDKAENILTQRKLQNTTSSLRNDS